MLGKQSDILILSYFLVSPAQIGYYNIACGVGVTVKTLLISGLSQVGVPIVVKTCEQDATRLTSVWELLVKFTALVSLPLLFWSILFARSLISVLYSDVYVEAAFYLQILGLFGLAERLLGGGASYSVLCVLGKERMVLLMRILVGITNLILNVFLVQSLGAVGVVLGTGFCNMIIVGIETLLLSQTLSLSYPSRFMFKLLSSVVVGGGCSLGMVYILSPALSIIQLTLAGALYFGLVSLAMYLLKPFDPKDVQMVSLIDVRLGRIANAVGNSR
jgi:O-antigen/teichoic acid export membrane protein